jgi:uncharacterized membrane protein
MSDVLLDTVLRPAPPLSPRAAGTILAIVAGINALFALYFISRGAWPILPFMGLDVALLAWAFRAARKAAQREEHILLTPALLSIKRRPIESETALNPYWVRVDDKLTLWSHGKGVRIGTFLPVPERETFAERLKAALTAARTARF